MSRIIFGVFLNFCPSVEVTVRFFTEKMVEELMPYRLEIQYIPGSETEVADYGSRNPVQRGCHEMFSTQPGRLGIAVRSSRVQSLDCVDPRVVRLARG